MKSRLYGLALLALATPAFAEKHALVIAVDTYAGVSRSTQQLHGAATDASVMKRLLDLYGFQSETLLGKDATRLGILGALGKLEGNAHSGDQIVLYFSGRGAVAPTTSGPYEPTLVPADAPAGSFDLDVRMSAIEEWATGIETKGAQVTIILDASYQNSSRADFGRQYNPTPRCLRRDSASSQDVREELYRGPGILLSACPARGAAYEWLVNATEEKWGGAFTDQLANAVVAALYRGEAPTFIDAMREVQAYFRDKVRADYMPGLDPFPTQADQARDPKRFDAPVFGGIDLASLPADSKLVIANLERLQRERDRKFRVALEVDSDKDDERTKTYAQSSKDLTDYLKRQIPGSEFAPAGAPPDVIVRLKPGRTLQATVVGDDLDKTKPITFNGRNFRKMLDDGLADYLELRGLAARIFRLSSTETPTWNAPLTMSVDAAAYSRGDTFTLTVNGPKDGIILLFDRDDADGVLQIAFPQSGAPYKQRLSGTLALSGQLQNDTNSGRMLVRGIVVPSGKGVDEINLADEGKFRKALLKQLRAMAPLLEAKKLPWATSSVNLRIR